MFMSIYNAKRRQSTDTTNQIYVKLVSKIR